MPDKDIFDHYRIALRKDPIAEKTEHTDRSALETLLNAFASEAEGRPKVQHEPRRVAGKGAPDYKVTARGLILGYVENKAIGENLDKILKSDQIKRYRDLSQNIILTDYLHFIWISKDGIKRETLCHETDLENPKFRFREDCIAAVSQLLAGFFSTPPEGIGRSQQLALALAKRSKLLRAYLGDELVLQHRDRNDGRLYGLYLIFRDQVFHELTLEEFADAFAQMLAYGLFLARLNSGTDLITLHNAREYVPGSFRLIRELVDFLTELEKADYREVRWVVEEVLSIVNALDLSAINEDLSFRHRKAINRKVRATDEEEHRLFERDPFIYFYEDYLKAYDRDTRKSRGVYYTPPPIVNFIVRAVDDILKDSFGIRDGLADSKRVTVLDFACGTGTFLLEVFQKIFDDIGGADTGHADLIVRDHILKNMYGFEYLIAPYTIAHLKLSQFLKDKGHPLKDDERLNVFLTNTLEPIEPQKTFLLPAISAEVEAAQAVKEKKIRVITGNPPYSGHSKNKGRWITTQIAKYREGFPELSKPAQGKWLQDDYVKFIRFAQMKMDGGTFEYTDEQGNLQSIAIEGADEGVVGIITNHSYLDNPTFKGMRKSLIDSFDQIYILDLHGSSKKKEDAPNGMPDQNVFDIEQGVAIALLVKNRSLERGVWHSDLWGKRSTKYHTLAEANMDSVNWEALHPCEPLWLFRHHDSEAAAIYQELWSLRDIFLPMGDPAPGIVTTHDEFAISFTPNEAQEKVKTLLATSSEADARREFRLCKQAQWNYWRAKEELPGADLDSETRAVAYRPFDTRWTIWNRNVAVHRRERATKYLKNGRVALDVCRVVSGKWHHVFAINLAPDDSMISNRTKERGFIFLSYLGPKENLGSKFRTFLDARYDHHYTPEEILGYIYAVLYAPAYRTRYAEFLRIDFPRIPFPESSDDFEALSKLGWALVQAHLLRAYPHAKLAQYLGKGDHIVEAVRYAAADQALWINKTQHFKPVPEAVWNYHIGGYQVIAKYLKSRKGRVLSLDEIKQVGAIADSLAFTIDQMGRIDAAYRAAFADVDK